MRSVFFILILKTGCMPVLSNGLAAVEAGAKGKGGQFWGS